MTEPIYCPSCGARNFKHEQAEPDWRLIAYALCIKYASREGSAVVGDGTLAWVAKHAKVEASRDTSTITLSWESPPLTLDPEVRP